MAVDFPRTVEEITTGWLSGVFAFNSYPAGEFEIYTMHLDGTDVRQLTVNAGWSGVPAWSPDGA